MNDETEPGSAPLPATEAKPTRRLPIGAEVQPDGGVHFRVWAPVARSAAVAIDSGDVRPMTAERGGYFSALVRDAASGTRYRFRLDDRALLLPDPASRFQPDGPHGSSQVVDPAGFAWSDAGWRGVPHERLVIYEMHVGTFTGEGTWVAALPQLDELAALGITCIEMMPVADFPGDFGWGYDGVNLFAPTRLYGMPDDLRRFVDRAHALGIAVILDVVYNHLGPDGNYLTQFSPAYLADRHANDWGQGLNFDGPDAEPVREFFIANAGYWIDEYHMDGLRLDATQQIFDASEDHILAAIARRARAAAGGRTVFIAAENEAQTARLVRAPEAGGYGLDALWNDDFHHAAMVALTGRRDAYYSDYRGTADEFAATAKHGFLYQGQRSGWLKQRRGSAALDLPGARFVSYLQNHDQVSNSATGARAHQFAAPGQWRALTAQFILGPAVPLLFQGQEFSASAPFLFFADHRGELGRKVKEGRRRFLARFASIAGPALQARLPDPGDPGTFRRCVLDHAEHRRNGDAVALHRDLLALRRDHPVFAQPDRIDAAALGNDIWFVRYFGGDRGDYLLVVNLGADHQYPALSEPLTAPPDGSLWRLLWTSEHPEYGGAGIPEPLVDGAWRIAGQAAIVLHARCMAPGRDAPS